MINRVKIHFDQEREYLPLEAVRALPEFFKQMMGGNGLFLKGYDTLIRVKFKGERPDGAHIWELETIPELIETIFTIQATTEFHVEVDYELINQKDNLLLGKIIDRRQTYATRQDPRNEKVRGNAVASNFLVAKTDIDFSKLTGVSSQVILSDIQRNVLKNYPQSKVIFLSGSTHSDEIDLMKEHKKPIFILDTETFESFSSEDVFDPKKTFEDEFLLDDKVQEYKKKKIGSYIYYPLFIQMKDMHFFAYLSLETERPGIPSEVLDLFKEVERTFQERIMDSNTHILDIKQNVLNVSRGGVALEVNDMEIIKALKVKPTFTLDINFKLQAPIRMAIELRHLEEVNDYYRLGGRITGVSGDKKAKEIYHSLIEFFG
ncbi:DUF1577 domain-containing protein [Leptospira congkakensis]|uniref:DUF1577 domain-containing protein n=1 Tax=Leptospira congkakensis TaxID=2484932 RepID=A0A4Z1AG14_9LEPT|nr:DUF1577 domain-containing protein [Leptospira congkakensis]TGL86818.1 DUF1577 domain-containing protein [Leptospira congkakensis]TGL93638.1 DUF1577 domain-containing protein [Leptospira congkakensis]TGL94956.1 DUF1577 domain-containing protein [Leptospira congkakensis]